jgi:trans-aconitate methyltransferase
MNTNNWNEAEVNRAERTWGHKTPQYTIDMFEFATTDCKSWLDLGCGFGRFLRYLDQAIPEPDYIGYDSSADMVKRIQENFPAYSPRVFKHDITSPINNAQESIICSAVLIHITLKDQDKVLNNIKDVSPKLITFDINCPSEQWLLKSDHFERFIKGCEGTFRMTWQSHYVMTRKILKMFSNYHLTTKFYDVHTNRHKVVYMLRRK